MATQKSNGNTGRPKRAPRAKKATTPTSAPEPSVAPVEVAPTTPPPAATPSNPRLTEVARTIGATVGAIAFTTRRALGRTPRKG